MTSWRDEARQALDNGERMLAVQDDDIRAWQAALHELTGGQSERPLLIWDEDGLRSQTFSGDLPDSTELTAAFDFVKTFSAGAAFLFDCTWLDLTSEADSLRRRLAAIGDRLAVEESLVLVVVTADPLPPALTRRIRYFGPSDEAEQGRFRTEAAAPAAPRSASSEFADIRDLNAFASDDWQKKLDTMSSTDVERLVSSGAWQDSLDRVNELRDTLKQRFAQKEDIIDAMMASAVAQVPCVLMGPPGTAKGHMIRSLCEGLGLSSDSSAEEEATRQYFEYQLTRFTTPEEIFGPIHVQKLLEEQSYRRVTDGYLPAAQIAFLDEIFKASSAILNTLLSLLNERVFYNEGRAQRVPLTTIFAASNEPPQDESLTALFDRFPIRINCPSVDDEHLSELMARSWEDSFDRDFGQSRVAVPHLACTNDLRLLHKATRVLYGGRAAGTESQHAGGAFQIEFLRCFRALRNEAAISDRSMASLYSYSRAASLLAGKQQQGADELDVFRLVKWDPSGELDRFVRNLKKMYRA